MIERTIEEVHMVVGGKRVLQVRLVMLFVLSFFSILQRRCFRSA